MTKTVAMNRFAHILAAAIGLLAGMNSFAFAAATDWVEIAGGEARLIVAEPVPGETKVDAALEVRLAPGWKTYWRDPGDAGVPLQVDLKPSANARLLEVLYPAPKRFDDGVTVWAGYDAPVGFGLKLERPDVFSPVKIKGSAFFGVCEKICVPVTVEFDVEAADSAETTIQRELVALRMARLPAEPMPGLLVTNAFRAGNILTFEAEASDYGTPPELFLAAPDGVQLKAPVLKSMTGGKLVFEAPILFWEPKGELVPKINYTLVSGQEAVSGLAEIPTR